MKGNHAGVAEDRASIRRICGLMNQDRCCYSSILNFRGLLALNSRAPSSYRSFANSYVSKIYGNLREKKENVHTEGWILCGVRFVVSSAALAPTQTALLTKCACAAEPSGLCNNEIGVNDNSWYKTSTANTAQHQKDSNEAAKAVFLSPPLINNTSPN